MQIQSPQQSNKNELSEAFFDKCAQLKMIEEPFQLNNIAHQMSIRDIQSQFQLLRALTQTKKHRLKLRVNSILQNKKNRFAEQSIYEHSRVILHGEEVGQGYINANWVPSPQEQRIIVTQGPLQQTQQQFESMLAEYKIQCVVMLCNIIQNGKVRCYDYCQNRTVEILQNQENAIEVSKVVTPNYEYTHVHYSEWPDKSIPTNLEHIYMLFNHILNFKRIAVHCSAGLGRSGVIAALLNILFQLQETSDVTIFGAVRRLREHRFGAIQNSEQYKFLYDYLKYMEGKSSNDIL